MENYSLKNQEIGKYKVLIIEKKSTEEKLAISLYGGFILYWHVRFNDKLQNVIDGYRDDKEIEEQNGARSCIMAPFSNRLPDGEYVFNGVKYKISKEIFPGNFIAHGFARFLEFRLLETVEENDKLKLVLYSDGIRERKFQGYPFDIDLFLNLTFCGKEIILEIVGKNVGKNDAPFSCGWHPYFKLNEEGINNLCLTIPFQNVVSLDENYLPYEGTKAYKPIESSDVYNFLPKVSIEHNIIGERQLNYCYSKPMLSEHGCVISELMDLKNKRKLSIKQKRGVFYAFTGEGLKRDERKSLALEPVEFITNAFNRLDHKELIILKSGEKRAFDIEVSCSNFEALNR